MHAGGLEVHRNLLGIHSIDLDSQDIILNVITMAIKYFSFP